MKVIITSVLLFLCLSNCKDDKKPIQGDTEFQRELNAEYKDATRSPLTEEDRKDFEGLDFF